MKDNKANTIKIDQPNAESVAAADIKWFDQFDDRPGIYDAFTLQELDTLHNDMLTAIKRKINAVD